MFGPTARRRALATAGLLLAALPATAAAAPSSVTNDVYSLWPTEGGGLAIRTADTGAALQLPGTITSIVRDYSPLGGPYDHTLEPTFLDELDQGFREQLTLTRCRGCGPAPLTVERDTQLLGTTRADSVVRVTLRVTNQGTEPTPVGLETIVPTRTGDDGTPEVVLGGATLNGFTTIAPVSGTFSLPGYQFLGRVPEPAPSLRALWSGDAPELGAVAPDTVQVAPYAPDGRAFAEALPADAATSQRELRYLRGATPESAVVVAPGQSTELSVYAAAESLATPPTPVISGTPKVGQTLAVDPASLPETTPLSRIRAYRWVSCPPSGPGAGCEPVAYDATGTYVVRPEDAGRQLLVAAYPETGGELASAFVTVLPADDATAGPDETVVKPPQTEQPAPAAQVQAPAPAAPAPTAVTVATRDRTLTVRFRSGSARLTPAAKRTLRRLARSGARTVTCTGYTASATGKATYRSALGMRRAKAVCGFLATRLDGASMTTSSAAGADPVASNRTRGGRARNRRVVVTLKA